MSEKLERRLRTLSQKFPPQVLELTERRRHRIPKGYPSGYLVCDAMGMILFSSFAPADIQDDVAREAAGIIALWCSGPNPIYCIQRDMLEDCKKITLPNTVGLLDDFDQSLNRFVICFPEGSMPTPEGNNLEFVVVSFSCRDTLGSSTSVGGFILQVHPERFDDLAVSWCGVDSLGVTWTGHVSANKGEAVRAKTGRLRGMALDDGDHKFIAGVDRIILLCMLSLNFEPELVEEATAGDFSQGVGFNSQKARAAQADADRLIPARWIGRKYKPMPTVRTPHQGGTHRRPKAHYRGPHARRVAIGKGRTDRKWIRVPGRVINRGIE
jgi:hypothetical protein